MLSYHIVILLLRWGYHSCRNRYKIDVRLNRKESRGIIRKLLLLLFKGPFKCRPGHQVISFISDHLLTIKSFVLSEFAKKLRSLKKVRRWKIIDFRQFLLYTVVLANKLPKTMYQNFLYFRVEFKYCLTKTCVKLKIRSKKSFTHFCSAFQGVKWIKHDRV